MDQTALPHVAGRVTHSDAFGLVKFGLLGDLNNARFARGRRKVVMARVAVDNIARAGEYLWIEPM